MRALHELRNVLLSGAPGDPALVRALATAIEALAGDPLAAELEHRYRAELARFREDNA